MHGQPTVNYSQQYLDSVASAWHAYLLTLLLLQVYSTSCGQDHWLLGLQYIFKAYRDPLITRVNMGPDRTVLVNISTKGILDKYTSNDPVRRAELQRSLELAAYSFAQVRTPSIASLSHDYCQ